MTTTIYVSKEAMQTINAIKDLDYYDRCELADNEATDFTRKEGYFLKNGNKLPVAILPDSADIVLRLGPDDGETYAKHVSMPVELRGCIFEKAPHLPPKYAEIVRHWSGETVNSNTSGTAFFQNPLNCYLVDLSALDAPDREESGASASASVDALLSEGIVVAITGLGSRLALASPDQFVEIALPVDDTLLGLDNGAFQTEKAYDLRPTENAERIFLRVADILQSPDPDHIYVDALRFEQLDYGWHY